MKFASLRFPLLVLCASLLVLGACSRRGQPPAEVIYRPKAEIQQSIQTAPISNARVGAVQQSTAPSRPRIAAPSQQVVIGLILPLTGSQAAMGSQMRDAALMGLYDALENSPKLSAAATPKLLIRDSAGSPDGAAKAAQELLNEGAKILLGPLASSEAAAAGKVAQDAGVALLSFSNNTDSARPNVYTFGFIPAQQVKRVADFAVAQQIAHYAAIAPQDDYGRMVIRDFSRAVAANNLAVQPLEFYNAGAVPPDSLMQRMTENAKTLGAQRKALFVPAMDDSLKAIAAHFMNDAKANGGFLKLLGTGLWDQAQTLADPNLQGAWFATTSPELSLNYNERFNGQYGYMPSRVASLAYDAVMLAAGEAIARGEAGVAPAALLRRSNFDLPANGAVRLNANGVVDRALAVVEVGSGFRVIAAPEMMD